MQIRFMWEHLFSIANITIKTCLRQYILIYDVHIQNKLSCGDYSTPILIETTLIQQGHITTTCTHIPAGVNICATDGLMKPRRTFQKSLRHPLVQEVQHLRRLTCHLYRILNDSGLTNFKLNAEQI